VTTRLVVANVTQQGKAILGTQVKIHQDQAWNLYGNDLQDFLRIAKSRARVAFHLELKCEELTGHRIIVDD
jgi:hypothetical protein